MSKLGRRDLVLLLIGLDPDPRRNGEVSGITRFQKFLFLLEKEKGIEPTGEGFSFAPYKAGPYSRKLYDDLEMLENLGYVSSQYLAEATEEEAVEIEELSFDELVGSEAESPDIFEERRYQLTEKGKAKVAGLLATGNYRPVTDAVRQVKSKFGKHSLADILYYVYTKYPEMTVESEIREKVLRRRGR